mmetsp:Transcript_3133/g.19332  ORF Transcript_3133/g.19332 Transcript_3133/m.19332 type:complete len:161 (+) Transcript_3133:1688-2170(+)
MVLFVCILSPLSPYPPVPWASSAKCLQNPFFHERYPHENPIILATSAGTCFLLGALEPHEVSIGIQILVEELPYQKVCQLLTKGSKLLARAHFTFFSRWPNFQAISHLPCIEREQRLVWSILQTSKYTIGNAVALLLHPLIYPRVHVVGFDWIAACDADD